MEEGLIRPLILVVDDDSQFRTLACEAMSSFGFHTEEAQDGNEAIALFHHHLPDLILLDLNIPGKDGYEVCEAIRKAPRGVLTPILVMTGFDDSESIQRAYEAGATDFATKPVNWTILANRARYMLKAGATARELALYRDQLERLFKERTQELQGEIWERKRTEKVLKTYEDKFHRIFQQSPLGIYQTSVDGVLISANAAMAALLGFDSPEDLLASTEDVGRDLYADPEERKGFVEEVLRSGVPVRSDLLLRRKDGRLLLAGVTGVRVTEEDGSQEYIEGVIEDVTERRKGEEKLRMMYRAVEQSPGSVIITDTAGNIEYVNPQFTKVTGYSPEEVLGTNPRFLKSSVHSSEMYHRLWATILAGDVWQAEVCNKKKDGSLYWSRMSISPVKNERGETTHFVQVAEDVTAYKQFEQVLREGEERYRTLFDVAMDAIIVLDQDSNRVIDANRFACQLYGYSIDEILHLTSVDLSAEPEKTKEGLSNRIARIPLRYHKKKDGTVFPVEISVSYLSSQVGTLSISVIRDITERKRAEQTLLTALRVNQAMQETLLTALRLNQAMQTGSVEDVTTAGLEEGVRLTGSRIGFFHLVHQDQKTVTLHQWSRETLEQCATDSRGLHYALEKAGIWADAVRERRAVIHNDYPSLPHKSDLPFGHVPLLREIVVPVFEKDLVAAVMGVGNKGEDYTEFDVAQLTLIAETVWNIVRMKWAEVDLQEAKRAAETATEAKSQFLANMSHEIRTPISAVMGLADMALGLDSSPQMQDLLLSIRTTATSLHRLINDILDFSKIEAGKLDLVEEAFVLGDLFEGLMSSLYPEAKKKGLELDYLIGPAVPLSLIGDANRLRQALMNLIGNALKFTETGRVHASVQRIGRPTAGEDALPGTAVAELRFSVSDTGIGILPEVQEHLFQSFVQADTSTSKKYGGTGLGLAITRQLVELMGGRIWLESIKDHGTTFHFSVKLRIAPAHLVRLSEVRSMPFGAESRARRLRILLAEDNPMNRKFLVHFLQEAGHEVSTAANGLEVLNHLAQGPFDLVLMDIQMPEMDGLEATKCIRSGRSSGIDPQIPIIALTAYAMKADYERFVAAGMDGYVTKPVDMGILFQAMDSALYNKSRQDSLRAASEAEQVDLVKEEELQLSFGENEVLRDFIMEAIQAFLSEAPDTLADIHNSVSKGDMESTARSAHRLVNAAGIVKAARVLQLSRRVEEAARGQNMERVRVALDALSRAMSDTLNALAAFELRG